MDSCPHTEGHKMWRCGITVCCMLPDLGHWMDQTAGWIVSFRLISTNSKGCTSEKKGGTHPDLKPQYGACCPAYLEAQRLKVTLLGRLPAFGQWRDHTAGWIVSFQLILTKSKGCKSRLIQNALFLWPEWICNCKLSTIRHSTLLHTPRRQPTATKTLTIINEKQF